MEYKSTDLALTPIPYKDFLAHDSNDIAEKFRQVIQTEGPVVDDFLELKVLKSYEIFQRGSQIAPFLRGILLSLGAVTTTQIDCDKATHLVFWPENFRGHEHEIESLGCALFTDFRPSGQIYRSIMDFPQIEVFNAMKAQLLDGKPVKKAELLDMTNHALGFQVKGRQIRLTLEKVLKAGIENGTFVYNRRAGLIRLRQESHSKKITNNEQK